MTTGTADPQVDTTKVDAQTAAPETKAPETKAPEAKAPETKTDATSKPDEPKVEEKKSEDTILGGKEPTKEDKKPEVKTQGAPEKYSDFTMPENVTLDKGLLEKATPLFKELGLSQEQAQKLVTLQAENAKASNDATLQEYQQKVDGWKADSMKLYGAKASEEFAVAGQAINRFGTPELRNLLNDTGLGNNPELVKFFVKVGHAIKEDNPADGTRVAEAQSDADLFFPSMKKK